LISWCDLCYNPSAIDIIKRNPWKIAWVCLIRNPAAMDLILSWKKLPQYFFLLCENYGAIDYIKKNQNRIYYSNLSYNQGIIELDVKLTNLCSSAFTKFVYNL
jgi:hypothetical protein